MVIRESEYNDDFARANIFVNSVTGSLGSYSDVDWFTFNNPYPTSLNVTFTVNSKGSWKVDVYDQNLQILSGRNIDATFSYSVPAYSVGNYAIRVQTTLPNGVMYSGGEYNITLERATYTVRSLATSYDEGSSALFEVTRTGNDNNYSIYYKLSGSGADDKDGLIVGKIPTFVNNKSVISVPLLNDGKTEGNELLNLSLGMYTGGVGSFVSSYAPISGATASVLVIDTSKEPVITKEIHVLDVLVDKGVLGPGPIILKGLTQNIEMNAGQVTKNSLVYQGLSYDYNLIDSLITTIVKDGEFSVEFRKEITELVPAISILSYQNFVQLVGVANIDEVLKYIAGADGNYVL